MADEIKIEYKEANVKLETPKDARELSGFVRTTATYPSWIPKRFIEQFALYISGSIKQWCVYDTTNNTWVCFEHTVNSPSSSISPSKSPSVSPSVSPS